MIPGPQQRVPARVVRPTGRGLAVGIVGAVAFILAYVFGRTELLLIGCLAMLLVVAAWLFVWLRRVRMTVTRAFSPQTPVSGHATAGAIELRNLSRYGSAEARWRETLPWRPFSTPLVQLPSLPAVGSTWEESVVTLHYEIVPPRRGLFDVGPFIIELSDPFGLARGQVSLGSTQRIAVIPDVEKLPLSGITAVADEGSARAQRFRALGGDDDVTTRNYRPGDALRRVHWRASAHRGELMVREEEQRSHAEARVVLDTTRAGYADFLLVPGPQEPQSERFEWALRVAVTLALHLEQRGFLVQLVETGPRQLTHPDRSDQFLESVASATLCPYPAPRAQAAHQDSRPFQSLGVVFAVVADADGETIETLTTQRRGFEVAVALIVPDSPARVDHPGVADRSEDTARFHEVAERLSAVGWRCVAAPPAESVEPLWSTIAPLLERGYATR
jgi:uncharacterized protein (DUF58 family)